MGFKAKLNAKFYIAVLLLLVIVAIGWNGIYFLNTNEILMEDNMPMDSRTKALFTFLMSVIILSWTASFFTLVRQLLFGSAFVIDENGIHNTATAMVVLAFILVVPVRTIPFSAIKKVSDENGVLTLHIDKTKIDVLPLLRPFVRKRFNLFSGFTSESSDDVKAELKRHIK